MDVLILLKSVSRTVGYSEIRRNLSNWLVVCGWLVKSGASTIGPIA